MSNIIQYVVKSCTVVDILPYKDCCVQSSLWAKGPVDRVYIGFSLEFTSSLDSHSLSEDTILLAK